MLYEHIIPDLGSKFDFYTTSTQLLKDLKRVDLTKPTILVGHSMGGLIIKSMVTMSDLPSLKGIVFYSTPHHGSKIATLASKPLAKKLILPLSDVTNLDSNSDALKSLNNSFLKFLDKQNTAVLSFYEECPLNTFGKGKKNIL